MVDRGGTNHLAGNLVMCARRTFTFLSIAAALLGGQACLYDPCISARAQDAQQTDVPWATPGLNLAQASPCLAGTTDHSQPSLSGGAVIGPHATCSMPPQLVTTTLAALQFHLQSRVNRLQV